VLRLWCASTAFATSEFLLCVYRSLLFAYRSLLCAYRSLLCAYRSLLCAYRSLLCQVVCVEEWDCGASLVCINDFCNQ